MQDINNIIDTTSYLIDSLNSEEQSALESTINTFDTALAIYSAALENDVNIDTIEDAFDKLDDEIENLDTVEEPDYAKIKRGRIIKNTIALINAFLVANGIVLAHSIYSREGKITKDSVASYMKTAAEMRKVAHESGIIKLPKTIYSVSRDGRGRHRNSDNYIINPLSKKKNTADLHASINKLTDIRNAQRARYDSDTSKLVKTVGDKIQISKSFTPTVFGNMYSGNTTRYATEGYDNDSQFFEIANESLMELDIALESTMDEYAVMERIDELEGMVKETLEIPDEIKRAKRERVIYSIFKKILQVLLAVGLISAATVTAYEGKFDLESIKNFIDTYKTKKTLKKDMNLRKSPTIKNGKFVTTYDSISKSPDVNLSVNFLRSGIVTDSGEKMLRWNADADSYIDASHAQKERRNTNLKSSIAKLRKMSSVSKNSKLDSKLEDIDNKLSFVKTTQHHSRIVPLMNDSVGYDRTRSSTAYRKTKTKEGVEIIG